jgi:IclR family acetate operon transcriptional repressor
MRPTERDTAPSMISRVSDILHEYQHDERAMSMSELSRRTGIPKASCARIVNEMVDHGLLERDDNDVRLGIRMFELGQQASRPTDLRKLALPHMSELMKATGQTVHLAVLEGTEVVYIQILRSKLTPALPSRVGGRLPAYATGVGKALLAHSSEELVEEVCSSPLVALGPRTITDPVKLRGELNSIKANHLAYEREESTANVGCAAAPILNSSGKAIAALSVSVHLNLTDVTKMGPAVSTVAMGISRELSRNRLIRN